MWHEARRSERKVHDLMDAARKRAERRADFLAKRRGDPQQALRLVGSRCRIHHDPVLYQAIQDQQGLIPWNGKAGNLIDRFDGRALLDFIREVDGKTRRSIAKTEDEEELEELVNFERYRDVIKHRRRGLSDEDGLEDVDRELEAKASAILVPGRQRAMQTSQSNKGAYSQVGFSYDGNTRDDTQDSDSTDAEDEEEEEESSSEDSEDDEIEKIGLDYGVQKFNWLICNDRKVKEEEKRQKEVAKGDPAMRKLSRKERRKLFQQERDKEREAARFVSIRYSNHDPYRETRGSPTYESSYRSRRERSRSRSPSLSRSRRHERSSRDHEGYKRSRSKADPEPKIEFITEFAGPGDDAGIAVELAPPSSPPSQVDTLNRHSSGRILEALHSDPAAIVTTFPDCERFPKEVKPCGSASSAIARLSKPVVNAGTAQKQSEGDKSETPQERLKRIMSKQLNKQIKKDIAGELSKRREQEKLRQEKLAETRRIAQRRRRSRSRTRSRSPPGRRWHSRSRSPRRGYTRSPS